MLEKCPVCLETLMPTMKGEDWFFCDNCSAHAEALSGSDCEKLEDYIQGKSK